MADPRRVRVQGDLYHGHVPEGAVYVGRALPGLKSSPWRNPFSVKRHGVAESLRLYREHLNANPELVERARVELAGKTLACWCREGQACHVDILLELIGDAHA